jgi:hypothetical protein
MRRGRFRLRGVYAYSGAGRMIGRSVEIATVAAGTMIDNASAAFYNRKIRLLDPTFSLSPTKSETIG